MTNVKDELFFIF